jgi:hypothetical protein
LIENLLPRLPTFDGPVTEAVLYRAVERLTDASDKLFLNGKVSTADYNTWFFELDRWAHAVEIKK